MALEDVQAIDVGDTSVGGALVLGILVVGGLVYVTSVNAFWDGLLGG